ncbi:MAG: CocE/NonD family hydrolase [Bacteroidota bacterium]
MKPVFLLSLSSCLLSLLLPQTGWTQLSSQSFSFRFEGKTLRGVIESPAEQAPQAMVLLIPGYGQTNFVEGKWYYELRSQLVGMGLSVVCWDKMGCGQSEGEFNIQQPVANSAEEALTAISELQRLKIPGSETLGLWGISRAGWICPLIYEQFPIAFWISVSGTDHKENFGYLVQSNLRIQGKEEAEVERLYQAWMEGHRLYCAGASYDRFVAAIRPLQEDSLSRELFGYSEPMPITEADRLVFAAEKQSYLQGGHFDSESGLWVYIEGFDQLLSKVDCPVLALFGAEDSQVDWHKTKQLYESTIAENPAADLTVKVFEQCNHSLQKCESCGFQEDLSHLRWTSCEGYYEAMRSWLKAAEVVD